ncbi:LPS assembly protein LptD [Desulfosarcina sp. OttesenSCG-928-G10]|nr:LPS assembly protein LptD [Desulfosarcina sp. OttesenSCG-928-G10]MDL2321131.1 LPS assembly protein LptD [Desulfosarcina sp. OttesenSCG-928-B08]
MRTAPFSAFFHVFRLPFVFPAFLFTLLMLLTGAVPTPVHGAGTGSMADRITGDPSVPWEIVADSFDYDAKNSTYHATGNVVIEKQATRLTADRVSFNQKDMTAVAFGNVILMAGDDLLTGDRIELDMARETGVLNDGGIFFKDTHFYIRGQDIRKVDKETYQAAKGSITTCDGDTPAWAITGREVNVTVEGYGTVRHATFRVRDVPVFYAPYLIFPVKTKRQTGLLMPEIGFSDRKGFSWEQPLFWAIGDSSDATVTVHHMVERGTKVGAEYRYALTDRSFGAVMADGMIDRRTDRGTDDTKKWGYQDDAHTRTNTDRYWLRAKLDQELPAGVKAKLDLDIVSDQDYLTEFRSGRSGFYKTEAYFLDRFGRELDTYDENIRTNQLNLNKIWSHFSFNGNVVWNDNVLKRRWSDDDDTLQQLPTFLFSGTKQSLFGTGLYWDLASEYTYFYREDGERGHRTDILPRVYLPMKWKNFLSFEPSVGVRQTTWIMDQWDNDEVDKTSTRQLYDLRLDLSTELAKVIDVPMESVDRIRHTIKPRVVYEFIPDEDQSDLPYFTEVDRIEKANRIVYSLTNTFTSRSARAVSDASPPAAAPVPSVDNFPGRNKDSEDTRTTTASDRQRERRSEASLRERTNPFHYQRFARIYLEQTYDIAAERDDAPEPFSDVYGELDMRLARYLAVSADAEYDVYDTRFSSRNVGMSFNTDRGDQLWVEHRYTTNVNESIHTTLSLMATDSLAIRGEYERDIREDKDIVWGVGFIYQSQCWALDVLLSKEDDDLSLSAMVNLMGISEIGR